MDWWMKRHVPTVARSLRHADRPLRYSLFCSPMLLKKRRRVCDKDDCEYFSYHWPKEGPVSVPTPLNFSTKFKRCLGMIPKDFPSCRNSAFRVSLLISRKCRHYNTECAVVFLTSRQKSHPGSLLEPILFE